MRILLSAYVCEPGRGSEKGTGWSWAETLCRGNNVTLLTDEIFRPAVEQARLERSLDRLRPVYIDVSQHRRRLHPLLDVLPHHRAWQRRALAVARVLHAADPFDAVHHVTYGSHRLSTELWRLGPPFLWGPVGGGERVSLRLLSPRWLGGRLVVRELLRAAWNAACIFDPRLRRTANHAAAIGVTTSETASAYPRAARHRVIVMAKSPLDRPELEQLAASPARGGPETGLSLAFAGRLIPLKAPTLAFHAFARYARDFPTAQLHVYGDGPLRAELERLAARLGVRDAVTLHGHVPRPRLLKAYVCHHALLFTSLHDSHPFTVVEGMAAGLPVVCLASGGVDRLVPEAAGVKVPPSSPQRVVEGLAAGLARLTADQPAWQTASDAARAHALDPDKTATIERMAARLYTAAGLPQVAQGHEAEGGQPATGCAS